jgi:hypothetical protein
MIMKNLVIGIIIGALLIFSGQAVAGSISKVGKKVQAEYPITVDGKVLEAKALAIDGQTTTPNRALADAVGYDVAFVNKEVIFTKKVDNITETTLEDQITILKNKIGIIDSVLPGLRTATDPKFNTNQSAIEESQKKLDDLLSQKSELESQLTQLEAQQ